jgi:hypothetical protein
MENKHSESLKNLIGVCLKDMQKKYPHIQENTILKNLDNLDPEKWQEGKQKIQLKEQKPLKEVEVKQAMVYAKKELVQIRQAVQTLLKELRDLPTYQYIKPQIDSLISSTDDLESLILNRFNEKQMKERSPKEWETLQKIRTFLIQQLLETYKKY